MYRGKPPQGKLLKIDKKTQVNISPFFLDTGNLYNWHLIPYFVPYLELSIPFVRSLCSEFKTKQSLQLILMIRLDPILTNYFCQWVGTQPVTTLQTCSYRQPLIMVHIFFVFLT